MTIAHSSIQILSVLDSFQHLLNMRDKMMFVLEDACEISSKIFVSHKVREDKRHIFLPYLSLNLPIPSRLNWSLLSSDFPDTSETTV